MAQEPEPAERVAEKCPTCGSPDRAKMGTDSRGESVWQCWDKWHTAPAETAEQRLAKKLGFDVVFEDLRDILHQGELLSLWNHTVRLEREHQVMREAIEDAINERDTELDLMRCTYPPESATDIAWHDGVNEAWKRFAIVKKSLESALSQIGKP